MTRITVIDYDRGNLFSVEQALRQCGADVEMVSDAQGVSGADALVLPGVGAFGDAMNGLHQRGLVNAIREYAATGRPLLGICIGMQLLFDGSDENPDVEGLGILSGRVAAVPRDGADGTPHKVPHIGWADITVPEGGTWDGSLLAGTAPSTPFYFVHSYTAEPTDEADRLADCDYHGRRISAAVRRDNVCGFQFHPEKSGAFGLAILSAFMNAGA